MIRKEFCIRSLERHGTKDQDLDRGVIRIAGTSLRELGGRDALVKVSLVENGRVKKSIVRIVRGGTGERALTSDQVALQYDDRVRLGIMKAGTTHELIIEKINEWSGLPRFLLGHSSPLVRRQAVFGLALMVVGAVIGFLFGVAVMGV